MVNFEKINHKPFGGEIQTLADHAINCLCICLGITWAEGYQLLLEQASRHGLMPADAACADHLLKSLGFYEERTGGIAYGSQMGPVMRPHFLRNEYGLIQTHGRTGKYALMAVLMPETGDGSGADCRMCGDADLRRFTVDLWTFRVETARARLEQMRAQMEEESLQDPVSDPEQGNEDGQGSFWRSHEYFQYYQPNPLGRRIGDCVIRAFSAVFEISWQEAVSRLGEAVGYSDTMVNGNYVFINLLIKNDFEKHPQLKSDGKLLTGKEFCKVMDTRYKDGERIFAFVGSSHVAAVLPYKDEDGKVHYKLTDSWDSSDRKICEYWVGRPKKAEAGEDPEAAPEGRTETEPGSVIKHPRFGTGTILSITAKGDDRMLEIDFGDKGIKKLSEKLLQKILG